MVGAASPAVTGSGAGGSGSLGAARGCSAGGPTGTAASASCRSSCCGGAYPAHPGETGGREQDQAWWRTSRLGEPSESDIAVILVGMRGCRRARPTTSQCIGGVPWAVPCGARGGGGGWLWWWFRAVRGRLPSTGTGAGGGRATQPIRRAIAHSPGWGSGPWALGGRRMLPGGAAQGAPP